MQNHQIKAFSCHTSQELEKQVNQWLTNNPGIEIVQFTQSESGGGGMEWNGLSPLPFSLRRSATGISFRRNIATLTAP